DVEDGASVCAGSRDLQEGPRCFGNPTAAADDLAHVALGHVQVKDVAVAVPLVRDDDLIRVLDEGLGDVLDELFHASSACSSLAGASSAAGSASASAAGASAGASAAGAGAGRDAC